MAKKIKHGAQRPPLSWIDKFIYLILGLLCFGLCIFSAVYLAFILPDTLHNDTVDVLWKDFGLSSWLATMPMFVIWTIFLTLSICGRKKRIPIFGNPNFKAKSFSPIIKVYPLVSPEYRENFTNKERKSLRAVTIFLAVWIPFSLLLYPMGLYPREVYLKNDTLVSYNMLNNESHRGHISSAESLKIHTWSPRHDYDCYIALTIYFDKENYTFELSDSIEDIEKAIHIKSFFHKDQIQISTPDRTIRKLISQYGSKNPDTIPLLYKLYEYTPK